ncbi:carbohydrate kinase [Citrobacter koseri]|uniref:Carbohydrate kinase n=1 Tax=Citrobacter koseri TaxID=545 RepID=A0A447UHR4_CITKO|nr:carbohydrate kinase [Citrobacter koseri]
MNSLQKTVYRRGCWFRQRPRRYLRPERHVALSCHAKNHYHSSERQPRGAVQPGDLAGRCHCIREALRQSGAAPESVAGIGFDATCSLVVLDKNGAPLPVSAEGDAAQNIIVWMDHRATEQAERINASQHPVLNYVGGKISPEMETPKILWLKENRREVYENAWQFFDLADFLTWRATGDLARSICTVTCKWTWLAHENRWDPDYFRTIGLAELADDEFARIGQRIVPPGTPCGDGLTAQAAQEMGLPAGTPVAVGLIDAHAGGIGTVGVEGGALNNMAYVFGTSSCTMTSTNDPVFVPGVWGPYYSAMVPGLWLVEGGQSAAGAAIDQLLAFHPAAEDARNWRRRQDYRCRFILPIGCQKKRRRRRTPSRWRRVFMLYRSF